jgi:hypothetical protein
MYHHYDQYDEIIVNKQVCENFFLFSYYRKLVKNFNVYILNFKSHYGNINFRKYYQYIFLKNHTECMYSDCIVSN